MEWRRFTPPSFERTWLPDGTIVDVCHCDCAGPNSSIHLNSFAVFMRLNNAKWMLMDRPEGPCGGCVKIHVKTMVEMAHHVIELLEALPDRQEGNY